MGGGGNGYDGTVIDDDAELRRLGAAIAEEERRQHRYPVRLRHADPDVDVAPFPTIDVERFAREGIPPIQWIREPYIARLDVGIAYGAPYIGKSTLGFSLATCVAAGAPWLDAPAADPAPVLYVDGEAGEVSVVRLAMRFGAPIDGLHLVSASGSLSLLDSACVRRLHRTISDLRPALVILDSVSTTFGLANENDSTEVRRAMEALFVIRDKFGCTTLALHHTPKSPTDGRNARSALERIRGSSAFGAMASLAWHLEEAGPALDLTITKARDRDLRDFSRRIEQVPNGELVSLCTIGSPDESEGLLDTVSRAVVALFDRQSRIGRREIVTALATEHGEKSVDKALRHLAGVGRLNRPSRGIYESPTLPLAQAWGEEET